MEELIDSFLKTLATDRNAAIATLKDFCETNSRTFSFGHVDASIRKKFTRCLIDELSYQEDDKKDQPFTFTARCLEALRLLSRDHSNLEEMVTEDSCQMFLKLAGLYTEVNGNDCRQLMTGIDTVVERAVVVIEALKCVCNLVFQDGQFRKCSIKYKCTEGVCLRLMWFHRKQLPREVKFFDLRLLFVLTALEPNERITAFRWNVLEPLTDALDLAIPGGELRKSLINKEIEFKGGTAESTLPAR